MDIFVMIIVAIAMSAAAYMLAPKAGGTGTESANMDDPTAESDKTLPVVFGTLTIKSPNFLWVGDKSKNEYDV